ncbi:MAG: ATP-dependent helicase HrpB [Desulfuromonadales bacterium]|nr:ATP-dependent helicase HrpB [Desulfuromonadales bacterium]
MRPVLPIDAILPQLQTILSVATACVLQAPPGAGKTTRVPLELLNSPWLAGQSIILLEPRRLAATNAAHYLAAQLGEKVGGRVGYTIRFERKVSSLTRIEVVTEGILTRRLQNDPELTGVGLVIFDEIHERNLNSDLALALCRDAQLGLRPELRLLAMSATLDAAPLAKLLGDAPLLSSSGRAYPVEVIHLGSPPPRPPLAAAINVAIRRALTEGEGDLLVVLPGVAEIKRTEQLLADLHEELLICPLYADLPFAAQEKAILPDKERRKIVLATNIAETSLTIDGVKIVIDGGWERRPRFDAARGMSALDTVRISLSSAVQRAGRAGRLAPGRCYRLWSSGEEGTLLPYTPPEIRSADLAPLALELARWGIVDAATLCWLDPPPAGHLAAARALLAQLGALDPAGRITPLGQRMAELPAHPRLARILLTAQDAGEGALGATLAALLSERDPLRAGASLPHGSSSDVSDRLELFADHSERSDAAACATIGRAARQFRQLLGIREERTLAAASPELLARLLSPAFPDRIGRERDGQGGHYLLASGVGAQLSSRSRLKPTPWLLALQLRAGRGSEGEIDLATPLDAATLQAIVAPQTTAGREVGWDERAERVVGREVRRFGAILFNEKLVTPRLEEVVTALCSGVRRLGLERLNWSRGAQQLRGRVSFVSALPGESHWPDFSDAALLATLEDWLGPFLTNCRSRADLERCDPLPALAALLDWQQQRRLDELAPEKLVVPSGSILPLDYPLDGAPHLEVKLQELFGLGENPRIGNQRVAIVLHLLSPARRPLAVTQDLRNFWDQDYPEVKKEMRGRYPKHPWPDDPWSAVATRHTKKRSGQ